MTGKGHELLLKHQREGILNVQRSWQYLDKAGKRLELTYCYFQTVHAGSTKMVEVFKTSVGRL